MSKSTTILIEEVESFDSETGEITNKRNYQVKYDKLQPTDEFVKVSKYLNVIFAYNNIPLSLVPISLLLAQRMQFKTNIVYLLKSDKEEIAQMLDCSFDRVKHLIVDLKKHDIIRPTGTRGIFEVNAFLFSTGNFTDTRQLQAKFDFDSDTYKAHAEQCHLITGETVRKTITSRRRDELPGQMSLPLEKEMDYE